MVSLGSPAEAEALSPGNALARAQAGGPLGTRLTRVSPGAIPTKITEPRDHHEEESS